MELREFAEQVVFAKSLDEKLWCPKSVTDAHPGPSLLAPPAPGRPPELSFRSRESERAEFPGLSQLDQERARGRLLHFFANHELLATELMALVLLRFPEAPASFRRGVLQTLKDEQIHTRLYLERMRSCGIEFGALPVSGYIWRCLASMANPLEYVAGLSLTFEQANLDYSRYFAEGFERAGDLPTAELLKRIYQDEIGHVAYGLKWFRRWKDPQRSDWDAFTTQLKFPLSPQRAKGPQLNIEGRRAAGFDSEFIAELSVYAQSKGRPPGVFVFNPLAEGYIAYGKTFTPKKHQAALASDLENLPQFLSRQDDILLVRQRPPAHFLSTIKEAGFVLPEFIELEGDSIGLNSPLRERKLGRLRPWAWSPDSVQLLEPLFGQVSGMRLSSERCFNETIAQLYSKAWSANLLRKLWPAWAGESWICTELDIGIAVNSIDAALDSIAAMRQRGHHRIIAKQSYGLAGQNSLRLWEPELLASQRQWLERALANARPVVIEPWLERAVDFSIQLEMGERTLNLIGYTGLLSDPRGQFQGNWASPDFARRFPSQVTDLFRYRTDFSGELRRVYDGIRAVLQAELIQAGYVGPAGLDAFVYRTSSGAYRIKPIVEINPRYTMGRLLLELMRRTSPGSGGLLRLINHPIARAAGYEGLADYGQAIEKAFPIFREGQPVPKIKRGALCLNEPARARVCLAVFQVGRAVEELLGDNPLKPP
jgi:uncharacterized ferritin-like protein (DUF455 family)